MIFELSNHDRHITLSADDFEIACAACLYLGAGEFGLKQTDGQLSMPSFLLGGSRDWYLATFHRPLNESVDDVTMNRRSQAAACFESAAIAPGYDPDGGYVLDLAKRWAIRFRQPAPLALPVGHA